MQVTFVKSGLPKKGALVFLTADKGKLPGAADGLPKATLDAVRRALKTESFEAKSGESVRLIEPGDGTFETIIVMGAGPAKDLSVLAVRKAGAELYKALVQAKTKAATVLFDDFGADDLSIEAITANAAYGALLQSYRFDKYKTKEEENGKPQLDKITFAVEAHTKAKQHYATFDALAEGVFFTRDLVSEPANVLHPVEFATRLKDLEDLGVGVTILGEKEMKKLGMGAIFGVGQGSSQDSQIVILEWKGAANAKDAPVAVVGKGVTFDTGGISIKPAQGMEMMKWDMGGAGTVSGLIKALARRKAKVNVVGAVGLVENMPSGEAQRPGDVVTSLSGQTIEVINTDAEGRLVLADVLWYVQDKYNPKLVVDLATLTGAILISLANEYAGLFSNDDALSEQLLAAGKAEGEELWRMPMGPAFDKMIKSDIADMKNVGPREAGSTTAAQFLERFIRNGTPWAHLDIAGMAWSDKDKPTVPKGGTGFGVRLLNRLIEDNYEDA